MCALRFGSYSIAATLAGTPSLRRLKSILRYLRLAPPPRWREVTRPWALRPPDLRSPSVSDFSGSRLGDGLVLELGGEAPARDSWACAS